jgi:hypothetical protein
MVDSIIAITFSAISSILAPLKVFRIPFKMKSAESLQESLATMFDSV